MENYNYLEEMVKDIISYIEENEIEVESKTSYELQSKLEEELWDNDSVTGNASGSYWCNSWKAEEAICHNWNILEEAISEFGYDREAAGNLLIKGAEWADVLIRCYLLPQAITEAIESLS